MAPAFTAPLPPEVLMSSMQEEVASAKSCQLVLDLFHLPGLRWRTCNLLVVKYAVLCTPPGDRAGWGWYSGGKQLLQPHGVHSWLGQAAPLGGKSLTGGGDGVCTDVVRRPACAESHPEIRAGIWSWAGGQVRLKRRAGAEP